MWISQGRPSAPHPVCCAAGTRTGADSAPTAQGEGLLCGGERVVWFGSRAARLLPTPHLREVILHVLLMAILHLVLDGTSTMQTLCAVR
jgi:hypothetical protein